MNLAKTVDYAAVADAVGEVAEANKARLLETLLSDIADTFDGTFSYPSSGT